MTVPIGKPIGNTRIYILDGAGEPVPVGVEGEIYIAGSGVARGYLNREELTAASFLADPFDGSSSGRMYKTGDMGRWLVDGTIEYRGRNDFQVKIRGFRIELAEIEGQLRECEGVKEAVVLATEDVSGDKRLVGYVIGQGDRDLDVSDLRESLLLQLPDYMVPSAYVVLDSLPLTANGKLDRGALPAPEMEMLSRVEYEAPQGEVEEAVAALWQELLHVPRVGRQDNFFELGGHSLLAVQLQARIRETLLVQVPLRNLIVSQPFTQLCKEISILQMDTFIGADMDDMEDELSSLSAEQLQKLLESEKV